jgi:hypothetical protein
MQTFNEKKPYLIATVFSLVGVVGAIGLLFHNLANVKEQWLNEKVLPSLEPLEKREVNFNKEYKSLIATTNELHQLTLWMNDRYHWGDVLTELREVLKRTEARSKEQINNDTGIWIEQFLTTVPRSETPDMNTMNTMTYRTSPYPPAGIPEGMSAAEVERARAFVRSGGQVGGQAPVADTINPTPAAPAAPGGTAVPELAVATTNEISFIKIICRGVDLSAVDAAANTTVMYTLEKELKASTNWFDPKQTQLMGQITVDDTTHTFTIGVLVALKHPLKL